ncbi:MAG: hypothetical protein AAF630_02385 [Cyanobacteria bacterium P01_C01_bin.38]
MSNIFIPVILGTTRESRMSELVASFVYEQVEKWHGFETELTVLPHGRLEVCIDENNQVAAMNYHANKPCPEKAARMGTEETDTVMEVSSSQTDTNIKVVNN